jgi:hypothetical protein
MEDLQPSALPQSLPKKLLGIITQSIVVILGLAILVIVIGAVVLAWFDKSLSDAVIAILGVMVGYLGNAIQGDKQD